MVRIHHATCHYNRKNSDHLTFIFDRTWRAFFGLRSSGGFHWHDWGLVSPMIRRQLWTFWTNLDRRWTSSTSLEQYPYDVIFAQNFVTIFAVARFMPKISVKIAWHESNYMATSSAISLIVIRRLPKIIFFTASMFSLIIDVLGRLGRTSLMKSSRPSLNRLYHNSTFVLLIRKLPLYFGIREQNQKIPP